MVDNKADAIVKLEQHLSSFPAISRYDSDGEAEASRIANSLYDIVGAAKNIERIALELMAAVDEASLLECMSELDVEIRHIRYHIDDMRFFSADQK